MSFLCCWLRHSVNTLRVRHGALLLLYLYPLLVLKQSVLPELLVTLMHMHRASKTTHHNQNKPYHTLVSITQ